MKNLFAIELVHVSPSEGPTLDELFTNELEKQEHMGNKLHSWRMSSVIDNENIVVETIIAVFGTE